MLLIGLTGVGLVIGLCIGLIVGLLITELKVREYEVGLFSYVDDDSPVHIHFNHEDKKIYIVSEERYNKILSNDL